MLSTPLILFSSEDFQPIVLKEDETGVKVELTRDFIKDGLTIEGVGTFDRAIGILTFYSSENGEDKQIGELLKEGWRFKSAHEGKLYEWRFYMFRENQYILVGFAKNEQELTCEFVELREDSVSGKSFSMRSRDFFSINNFGSGFTGVHDVDVKPDGDERFFFLETTTGQTAKYTINFEDGNLQLVDVYKGG